MAVSLMRGEMRRHFTMNCCLIAAGIVASTAITNERGVFSPVGFNPFSATVQAFEALAGNPIGALRNFGGVPSVVPLRNVGAPGAVRRGLVNGLPPAYPAGLPIGPFDQAPPGLSTPPLLPEEIGGGREPNNVPNPGPGPGPGPSTLPQRDTQTPITPVPEPALWMTLIAGLGAVGAMLRGVASRRRTALLDG